MKYGIADYGLLVWYGGHYDYEEKLEMVKRLGYDGVERLYPASAEDALRKAAWLKKRGMSFATCNNADAELAIKWSAALGSEYVWVDVKGTRDFEDYLRQVRGMCSFASKYGVKVAVHNHLGSFVETQEQVERVMNECPEAYLLLDTGHLSVAGGDAKYIADKYYDRIVAYHLKGWVMNTPDAPKWQDRGYFCGLNQGNFPIDNEWVYKNALRRGFNGWMMIEHDTHKRDPELDLAENREMLKKWESEV